VCEGEMTMFSPIAHVCCIASTVIWKPCPSKISKFEKSINLKDVSKN
jgi:hypothetical protein